MPPQVFNQDQGIPLLWIMDRMLQRKRKGAVRKPNGGNKRKLAKRHIGSLAMPITNDVPVEIGLVRVHLNPAKTLIVAGIVSPGAVVRLYQLVVHLILLGM
jgi:hypothetical protein